MIASLLWFQMTSKREREVKEGGGRRAPLNELRMYCAYIIDRVRPPYSEGEAAALLLNL